MASAQTRRTDVSWSLVLRQLRQDLVHFAGRVRAQRARAYIALHRRCEIEGRQSTLVIGLQHADHVALAHRPEDLAHVDAELLCNFLRGGGALGRVLDPLDTLFGEAQQADVGDHAFLHVFQRGLTWYLELTRPKRARDRHRWTGLQYVGTGNTSRRRRFATGVKTICWPMTWRMLRALPSKTRQCPCADPAG